MWWSKNKKLQENKLKVSVTVLQDNRPRIDAGDKHFEHTLDKPRSSEIADHIAKTQSSPFFPIRDPKLAQQVRVALATSLDNHETRAQCNARLSKLISDPKLADDIAHTEAGYIYGASMIAYGKESGATDKVWYNSANPCSDCLALNEKQVKIDALFSVKDKIDHPPLHTGCNCGMRLVYGKGYDFRL